MKKKTDKILIGVLVLAVISVVCLIASFFVSDKITTINTPTKYYTSEALSCKTEETEYPYISSEQSIKKDLQINIIFNNDHIDKIALIYSLTFNNENLAKNNSVTNAAKMNNLFGDTLGYGALNLNYIDYNNISRMTISAKENELNDITRKYFMLDEDANSINEVEHLYISQGLLCERNNN